MSDTERGPLRRFEVTWQSGHVEYVMAHQCLAPSTFSMFGEKPSVEPRWMFHGEVDGHWGLILAVVDSDLRNVRDVTADERVS